MITSLHRQGYTLLAERVETHDEFEQCKALGFSLFQGYFYQRSQIQTTRTQRHSTSRANQMQLLDCVHIIGLKELRTLVSIVMLAGNNPASKVNLINGLTRAFACEALAEQRGLDAEEAFIVGLFSRMPVILGIELEAMLQELPLSQSIHKALASYAGALGQLLVDIAACEQGAVLTSVPAEFMLKAAAEARALMDSQLSQGYRFHDGGPVRTSRPPPHR